MSPLAPIACCIEAPPAFVPKARWALNELLAPLGLAPVWTDRSMLADGGLYYGPSPENLPERALALRLHTETTDYFDGGEAYDSRRRDGSCVGR